MYFSEIARQAAQIKLLRKLQKQEQARVAKEAKKQQGGWFKWQHKPEEWFIRSISSFSDNICALIFHHSNNGCWGEAKAKRTDKDYETTGMCMQWNWFLKHRHCLGDLFVYFCVYIIFILIFEITEFHINVIYHLKCHLSLLKFTSF